MRITQADVGNTFTVRAELAHETLVLPGRLLSVETFVGAPWATARRPVGTPAFIAKGWGGKHPCAVAIDPASVEALEGITFEDAIATRAGIANRAFPDGIIPLLVPASHILTPWTGESVGQSSDSRRAGLTADLMADLAFFQDARAS
ncbi:hypothetical protein GCM10025867_49270 (plasmid) [Frondihabitans sucicola]|uniref:Uncharacterized protein n=1 Tax=Frondihabitans sucicola TaxID=1268041 RepID=A0ABM8GW35_9MICO|nr:hypothetical protein [Frondihabitans sucicola]BDZ52686.1 hypothetical protein GCM10025867_49270 [Frondihabitans sucicola]